MKLCIKEFYKAPKQTIFRWEITDSYGYNDYYMNTSTSANYINVTYTISTEDLDKPHYIR